MCYETIATPKSKESLRKHLFFSKFTFKGQKFRLFYNLHFLYIPIFLQSISYLNNEMLQTLEDSDTNKKAMLKTKFIKMLAAIIK